MYEVEVKVRADHGRVRDRLADLGADRLGSVEQVDTYYDAPHREFADTDEALRVRRGTRAGETTTRVTYKGPLVDDRSKTREERETAVDDASAVDAILRNLGFEPAAVVEKDREQFAVDGYHVTLDDVAGLGEFVEVERTASADDIASIREGALALLRDLDLDPDEQITASYLELLLSDGS